MKPKSRNFSHLQLTKKDNVTGTNTRNINVPLNNNKRNINEINWRSSCMKEETAAISLSSRKMDSAMNRVWPLSR